MENKNKLLIGFTVLMVMAAIIAGLYLMFGGKKATPGPGKIVPRAQTSNQQVPQTRQPQQTQPTQPLQQPQQQQARPAKKKMVAPTQTAPSQTPANSATSPVGQVPVAN